MTHTSQIKGVDFHCHLDLYPDFPDAIARAETAGIHTLTVTTTPQAWPRNLMSTRGTRHVRAALGMHPQLMSQRSSELPLWEKYLPETRYVGEVGLDATPRYYRSFDVQRQVFQTILERCAAAGAKILSVHSVRSAPVVLDMVQAHLPPDRGRVVLHWFTGSVRDAKRAAALGCYFSVNAAMTRTDRGRALISALPRDRILTETDGPFTDIDGRPSQPADILHTSSALGKLLGASPDETTRIILSNLRSLLE